MMQPSLLALACLVFVRCFALSPVLVPASPQPVIHQTQTGVSELQIQLSQNSLVWWPLPLAEAKEFGHFIGACVVSSWGDSGSLQQRRHGGSVGAMIDSKSTHLEVCVVPLDPLYLYLYLHAQLLES
jgi:hypothetical protein